MSESPYAIRLELLKLSRDILDQQAMATRERMHLTWDVAGANTPFPEVPVTTTEDVIAQAELLNEFISRKS
jgi:hypothetical protein